MAVLMFTVLALWFVEPYLEARRDYRIDRETRLDGNFEWARNRQGCYYMDYWRYKEGWVKREDARIAAYN